MATSKSTAKLRVAGKVCNVGAWVIAAIGIGTVGIYISTILPAVPFLRQYQGLSTYTYTVYTNVIATVFFMVIATIFCAILLYALGTFMQHMSGAETKITETGTRVADEDDNAYEYMEDEHVKIVPLPEMK